MKPEKQLYSCCEKHWNTKFPWCPECKIEEVYNQALADFWKEITIGKRYTGEQIWNILYELEKKK